MSKMRYTLPYKKIIWGFFEIEADSKEEALKSFENGECEEFDNKCEYEYDINELECDG